MTSIVTSENLVLKFGVTKREVQHGGMNALQHHHTVQKQCLSAQGASQLEQLLVIRKHSV